MKPFGTLFFRSMLALAIVLMVVAAVVPNQASAMLAVESDDFNRCTPDPKWVFSANGVAGATHQIIGAYTGNSQLELTLPAGTTASFSGSSVTAPRLMTAVTPGDFTVEARFAGANIVSPDTDWVIQGLLFADDTDPNFTEWLRFDYNSQNNGLNTYAGYLRTNKEGTTVEGGTFRHIRNVTDIAGIGLANNNPANIRVNYVESTGQWTIDWMVGDPNTADATLSFNEAVVGDGSAGTPAPIAVDFDVTHVGFFVGNSGGGQPASVALIDYFEVSPDDLTTADDQIVLNTTANPVGSGTINRTACNNTTVTLQAVPSSGFTFSNWTGVTGSTTASTTTVNMTQSRDVVANFTTGVTFDTFIYLPTIGQ